MNDYENSKKARRIASIVYLVVLAFILTGTYFSNQQKAAEKQASVTENLAGEIPGGFSQVVKPK